MFETLCFHLLGEEVRSGPVGPSGQANQVTVIEEYDVAPVESRPLWHPHYLRAL